MDAVLTENIFVDFGADSLLPYPRQPVHRIEGANSGELRAGVRRLMPKSPGVYGMIDPLGRLVYVGKSKCLRNRVLSYFLPNNEEDKAGRIVQSTSTIVWEPQPSEFAALLREQSMIRQYQPRFNVQGIPRRQQPVYVCLGRQPAEPTREQSLCSVLFLALAALRERWKSLIEYFACAIAAISNRVASQISCSYSILSCDRDASD
jgi:excinuclease ABC subunit C